MKPQHSSIANWKTFAVAVAVAALAGMVGSAQAVAPSNQITVHNQDLNTGVIVLDSVTAAQDGWVVVYKNPNFKTGEIVGYAPVHQGTNQNVKVTIDTAKVGTLPTLWARLHVDNEIKGRFEGGLRNLPYSDLPVVENGHDVVSSFGTWATQGMETPPSATPAVPAQNLPATPKAPVSAKPASGANSIVVKNQDLNTGVIVLDSVTAAQDGWVVVYKNPNFKTGEIVGYAPVRQGTNQNVKVTIDTAKVGTLPTLWARLHVDNEIKGRFEGGLRNLPYSDLPVVENGHDVVAGFGTWATQ